MNNNINYTCGCGSKNVKVVEYKNFLKNGVFFVLPLIFLLVFISFNTLLESSTLFPLLFPFIIAEFILLNKLRKSKKYSIACADCFNNISIDSFDEIE